MTGLSYLTEGMPGTGGLLKQRPEDFVVEEQPLYEPTGQGEHLYLYIEKRLWSTSDVVRHLSRAFRVSKGEISYAGLKDKHAITRQYFSIRLPNPAGEKEMLTRVGNANVKLLWVDRHGNKLRRGHLAGNRFVIKVRGVDAGAAVLARRVLDHLLKTGAPNYVGQQRFGYRGVNHHIGRLMLQGQWQQMLDLMLGHPLEADHAPTRAGREAYERGDYAAALEFLPRHLHHDRQALDALRQGKPAREAVLSINRQQRTFFVSAVQSAVFNRVLDNRLCAPSSPGIDRLVDGDLAWKHDNRSVFSVTGDTAEKENAVGGRVLSFEVSPSGPMWGQGMTQAGGRPQRWEHQALGDEGLTEADMAGGEQGSALGSRRPLRVPLSDLDLSGGADEHGPYLRLAFGLPRGSFATAVLGEIMKPCSIELSSAHHDRPASTVTG